HVVDLDPVTVAVLARPLLHDRVDERRPTGADPLGLRRPAAPGHERQAEGQQAGEERQAGRAHGSPRGIAVGTRTGYRHTRSRQPRGTSAPQVFTPSTPTLLIRGLQRHLTGVRPTPTGPSVFSNLVSVRPEAQPDQFPAAAAGPDKLAVEGVNFWYGP